jgi:hypothetical protein
MPNDTKNSLVDFDLCLALAQQAINSQMEYAWKAWKKRSNFQDTISIFKRKEGGVFVTAKTGIEATISPLEVNLNVSNAKLAQVGVTLRLKSGKVKYFDEDEEANKTLAFKDWSISFVADLDKKPVDLNILRAIEPDTARTAEAAIKASGLPDSVFAIEYLFMKFTKVDLMLSDNKNVHIPLDVPSGARDKALASLNFLLQGELNDFVLGTVVRRNSKQATPTFALTDFVFNVNAVPATPEASTLSYLGMMANRTMPANLTIARTKLEHPWLRREMLDGTEESVAGVMAISRNIFMEKYLIPKFTSRMGKAPAVSGTKWTYSGSSEQKRETTDLVERDWETGDGWQFSIATKAGTNKLELTGRIGSRALMDGYTLGMRGKSAFHSEWMHSEGHLEMTGSVEFTGRQIGAPFELNPKLTYNFGSLVVDNDTMKGGAHVLNALEVVFQAMGMPGKTTRDRLTNYMNQRITDWSTWMKDILEKIDVDLSNHAFIPPGGGVFTFSKPRFTEAGDLMWNVIYIAP